MSTVVMPNAKSALSSASKDAGEIGLVVAIILSIGYFANIISLLIVGIGFSSVFLLFTIVLYFGWKNTVYVIDENAITKRVSVIGGDNETTINKDEIEVLIRNQTHWQHKWGTGTVTLTQNDSEVFSIKHIEEWETILNE